MNAFKWFLDGDHIALREMHEFLCCYHKGEFAHKYCNALSPNNR